jgi:O-antigen/teichoic acid export membrane protein
VPVLFAPIQATCNQILYGMNRHRPYSALAICEALVNLGLSIVLAKRIGIIGVAWGTLVPAVIVEGILLPMYAVRQLDIPLTSYYWSTLIRPILSSAPYLLALAAFRKAGTVWTWHGLLASGVASVCIYAICVWLFVLDADEKSLLTNRLKRLKPAKATTLGVEQSR